MKRNTPVQKQEAKNLTITKTWSTGASDNKLVPEYVYYKVFRLEEGSPTSQLVTADKDDVPLVAVSGTTNYTISNGVFSIPSNVNTVTINNLKTGYTEKVTNLNDTSDGVCKGYSFYVVECDSSGTEISGNNPSNNAYQWSQTKGAEKAFTIKEVNSVLSEAELSEGIKNELRETSHTVQKVWNDENNTYLRCRKLYYSA